MVYISPQAFYGDLWPQDVRVVLANCTQGRLKEPSKPGRVIPQNGRCRNHRFCCVRQENLGSYRERSWDVFYASFRLMDREYRLLSHYSISWPEGVKVWPQEGPQIQGSSILRSPHMSCIFSCRLAVPFSQILGLIPLLGPPSHFRTLSPRSHCLRVFRSGPRTDML